MGVVVALLVLTQATVIIPPAFEDHKQEQQGQADSESSNDPCQTNITEALSTQNSQINLEFQSFLLLEIDHQEEIESCNLLDDYALPVAQKAIKTLRRIISPNAP